MPNRSRKRATDPNEAAKAIVEQATGGPPPPPAKPEKNPAAVALGRLGGLKGGRARAKKLSKRRRTQIARQAALARWEKQP